LYGKEYLLWIYIEIVSSETTFLVFIVQEGFYEVSSQLARTPEDL
jgi:hypothetical protein